ncbi:MAG: DNA primase family protein, partial [Solirubrobacteraceae bacterium]
MPSAADSDLANAERFASEHAARLRHVAQRARWIVWSGHAWQTDVTGDAQRAAKATARRMLDQAATIDDDKRRQAAIRWALSSQSERGLRSMLTVASTEPQLVVSADDLDADPMLLACPNGTIDLRTGKLGPADPTSLITRSTAVPFDPAAECQRWERTLREVFDDEELIAFFHRWVGYNLTGDTREHVLIVLHGAGCNGKSTIVEVVKQLAGDLAVTAAFDTFSRTRGGGGPRNDLARLAGARIVVASESGEGRRLDEATVKEVTGGDTIAARFLYGEHFEFAPAFKLWLVTNHRPRIDGDDDAIWRRLRLIPFNVSFEGREDRTLSAKLH